MFAVMRNAIDKMVSFDILHSKSKKNMFAVMRNAIGEIMIFDIIYSKPKKNMYLCNEKC